MANFYGTARTNYFKVKDQLAFYKAIENISDIEVVRQNPIRGEVPEGHDFGGYAILVSDGDNGGFPSSGWDEANEVEVEFDLVYIVAEHLADGEVAIFMESGAEKMRYVDGYATAINNKLERRDISLNDIYDVAKELTTSNITRAEY